MNDKTNEFLFAPPGALPEAAITELRARGIIVVESAQWDKLKIVRADVALPTSQLLGLAGAAILTSDHSAEVFGKSVAIALAKSAAAQ